ncbi:ComEC/Rec2 family competence protein [Draconibacterium halophilum]|uniref:ComEC/Rec2 family competence protein n=1 Tax=Draconibacterium halophilum TaxID=2706887 RepID=A0A6C0RA16_9BACT|nr:ComEC/Rec2 family competence protein [Draconibacterium halophilum]QIA07234.1 ComEC/Rec2 family competence protein [Draconibacterium halophilum]
MENTFKNIPFLRITVAFATGIYLASVLALNATVLIYLAFGITGCLVLIHKYYNYYLSPLFGIIAFMLIALSGAITYEQYNNVSTPQTNGLMAATVLETPQEKTNSYKSLLLLHSIKTEDTLIGTREKILVYFEKAENIKQLKPGSQIIFEQSPELIENRGNPHEFDYKKYLEKKHIFRQVYLKTENWNLTGYINNAPLIWAETIRNKLLKIYRDQEIGTQETEILSALTLGYKRQLDRETKRVFSSAGAMHVLAVSGLHVGILFFTFSFCFGFLQKHRTGRFIYVLLSIGFLWCYAFITGLSPSVLRACTMFSLIIIAGNINRRANIYNTLAASACLLLLVNPNNLFEVGFQLSYTAVFGIVFLQPRIAGLWHIKNKVGLFFWNLITVSIAAQIATFPLSAYYFNQFPTYFLLSNIVVIPAAMLLIPLGLGLLAFSQIPLLANLISAAVKWIIKGVYFVLSSIESFPISTPDVVLHMPELLLVSAILFSIFLFLNSRRALFLKSAISFGVLLASLILFSGYKQINQHEIIVLNSKEPVACFIAANKMYVISEDTLSVDDYNFSSVQDIKRQKRLADAIYLTAGATYRDDFLLIDKGLAIFEGKNILLKPHNIPATNKIVPDIIVSSRTNIGKELVPEDCCYIKYYPDRDMSSLNKNQHILSVQGAFTTAW